MVTLQAHHKELKFMKKIEIASELVKIAKSIVSDDEFQEMYMFFKNLAKRYGHSDQDIIDFENNQILCYIMYGIGNGYANIFYTVYDKVYKKKKEGKIKVFSLS